MKERTACVGPRLRGDDGIQFRHPRAGEGPRPPQLQFAPNHKNQRTMTQRGNLTRATAPATKPSQRLRDRQRAKTRPLAERRLSDFLPLGPAEQLLLDCCRVGEMARLAEQRPEVPDPTNRIRASFLRFLLLGGDEQAPVHERGVRMSGYWVEGRLDLGGCAVPFGATLVHSHFAGLLFAQDARLSGPLSLAGSCLSNRLSSQAP